jgi:hypothetical protein
MYVVHLVNSPNNENQEGVLKTNAEFIFFSQEAIINFM